MKNDKGRSLEFGKMGRRSLWMAPKNLGIVYMNASLAESVTPFLITTQLDLNDLVVWYKLGTIYYFQ